MMDVLLIVFIVAAAATYVVWKFMPRAARGLLAAGLARIAQRHAGMPERNAARLAQRLSGSECGACDTCGGCSSQSPPQRVNMHRTK